MTDIDEGVEGDTTDLEGVERLVSHLVEKQGISLLVHCMERFNEMNKDESDGVHNAMTVVENLIDFKYASLCFCYYSASVEVHAFMVHYVCVGLKCAT